MGYCQVRVANLVVLFMEAHCPETPRIMRQGKKRGGVAGVGTPAEGVAEDAAGGWSAGGDFPPYDNFHHTLWITSKTRLFSGGLVWTSGTNTPKKQPSPAFMTKQIRWRILILMLGIGSRDKLQGPEQFWRDYSARYGETVYVYGLARYLSGWAEFREALWGLLIATSGGCRFHHFPHEGWIQALSRASLGGDAPQEKTLFIPHGKILGVELRIEKSWWKKFFNPALPHILIHHCLEGADGGRDSAGDTLVIEADQNAAQIVRYLQRSCSTGAPECR